jgi:superfamily II DNA/RNA helicase
MIFTRTKRKAQKIADELTDRGFAVGSVHGDLGQGAREQALRAFRNGKVDVLVATDVAARGIDVDGVTHVVNYECPDDEKTYLHRIGRTGRAGASGVAVTLVDWEDIARWQMIDKILGLPFKDPIETYSTSDHVYTGLGVPRDVTGRLGRDKQTRAGLQAEEVEDLGETGRKKPAQDRPRQGSSRSTSRGSGQTRSSRPARPAGSSASSDASAAGDAPAKTSRRRRRTKRGGAPSQGEQA